MGPDDLSALAVKMSLREMFKSCVGNEQVSKESPNVEICQYECF